MHKQVRSLISILLFILLLAFTGCGSSTDDPAPIDDSNQTRPDPVEVVVDVTADAGTDQNILTSTPVILDGSGSKAPAGSERELTYHWEAILVQEGSNISLSHPTSVTPVFTTDKDGSYEIRLTVTSGEDSKTDTIVITATTGNIAPDADAGSDQNVKKGSTVTLDGSGSIDPNGDKVNYRWSLENRPGGSNASLSDATGIYPSFIADKDGGYDVKLIVDDTHLDSKPDSVLITASSTNVRPVAKAGADQNIKTGDTVTLDGSKSSDADGDKFDFRWNIKVKPPTSMAKLSNPTTVKPTFTADLEGIYKVDLVVNDKSGDSTADTVNITVSTANSAPIADAGSDLTVHQDEEFTLDSSQSSDADNDKLTYLWTLIEQPPYEDITYTSNDPLPSIWINWSGTYVFSLLVNDTEIKSAPDYVTITVTDKNRPPFADAGPDQIGGLGGATIINGSNSGDEEDQDLIFTWTLIYTPPGDELSSMRTQAGFNGGDDQVVMLETYTPGEYIVELTVEDSQGLTATDRVIITLESIENQPPIANAGGDYTLQYSSDTQLLDARESYDPDGDPLTYRWYLIESPYGDDRVDLSGTAAGSFEAMVNTMMAGTYVLELIVNDGIIDSDPDFITIIATENYN